MWGTNARAWIHSEDGSLTEYWSIDESLDEQTFVATSAEGEMLRSADFSSWYGSPSGGTLTEYYADNPHTSAIDDPVEIYWVSTIEVLSRADAR